ncbi:type IV secretion system DNA-binding domain-containing protein [Rickettsia endosymbiont of Polydrusus tereticollis]|uniref:type IV secretion system DNA-binding domain-containing protein n=1 Tax=Rickettsia endosymbiont of Polydrusus tereticollis TaxID=3066251 RepID=UPI0031331BB8
MKSQKQDSFTRGSQVFAHQVRMFLQGCINSFIVGLILTVIWIIFRSCHKITYIGLYYFFIERYVQIKLLIGQFFYHNSSINIKFYYIKKQNGKLVEPKVLAKMLYKAKAASLIKIAGLPLVKNSEGQHIILIGTTGSGKTNTLNILLPQLRSQGHRAIYYLLRFSLERSYSPSVSMS